MTIGQRPGPYLPRRAPRQLTELVVCRWDATMSGKVSMVPDGCVEIMWLDGRGPLVCGPETAGWSAAHQRPVEASGVRLRPGVARVILGVPISELRDIRVQLDDLLPAHEVSRTVAALDHASPTDRSTPLLDLVVRRVAAAPSRESVGAHVVQAIETSDGITPLADRLGVTTRQLHRRCLDLYGYGPATLRRIMRVQRFLALHKRTPRSSIGALAADTGYADHSHLVRDCKDLTGLTPTQLVGSPQGDWHGDGQLVDVRSVQDNLPRHAIR